MELTYRSQKQQNLTQELNQRDHLYRSIRKSFKEEPNYSLPKSTKLKIQKYLQKDSAYRLSNFLNKQAIQFQYEVGPVYSQWNILHLCVKYDGIQCLDYILKKQFQQFPEGYQDLINSKTIQGYTPTMVAIMHRSNACLQHILLYGGINIHAVDNIKRTTYEIALTQKNQKAIKLLMNYENKSKKRKYINQAALNQPIIMQNDKSICDRALICLFSCISLGIYNREQDSSNKHKINIKFPSSNTISEKSFVDYVQIGSSSELAGYDIVWKRAAQVISNRMVNLFESYNPFDICECNFSLKNNLIIFQCISQHPWLLRKLISPDKNKNHHYNVFLYPYRISQKISIDDHIPFIKDRNQPMFFSDNQQLWPMLVQKALAKCHNSYLSLQNIQPCILMHELTGFHTFSIQAKQEQDIIALLEQLQAKGYLFFLIGNKNSSLHDNSNQECFSVLQFFEKNGKRLILVHCPYVLQSWKQKQKYETLNMKIIKSHYQKHNQMCVWIQSEKFLQYFTKVVISYTLPNYQRSQLKIITNKYIFWKFRVQYVKPDEILIALYDGDTQNLQNLSNSRGWRNDGYQTVKFNEGDKFTSQLLHISAKPGQYLCKYQLPYQQQNLKKNYLLVCWSIDYNQLEFVQEQFAIVQWFACFKKYAKRKWKSSTKFMIEKVGDKNIIITKHQRLEIRIFLNKFVPRSDIVEGVYVDGKGIELINEDNFYFTVFKGQIKYQQIKFTCQQSSLNMKTRQNKKIEELRSQLEIMQSTN